MAKCSSLIPVPHLGQQPTIPAIWVTDSSTEVVFALVKLVEIGLEILLLVNVSACVAEVLMRLQVNILAHALLLSLQWLTVAAWKTLTMVKWISPIQLLSQQLTTLAIGDTD